MTTLEAALEYAARGWPVLPIYEPEAGWCSCKDTDCRTPAKHPRNKEKGKEGLRGASTEAERIKRWWKGYPRASVAIVLGEPSRLMVLNVAPGAGEQRLAELEADHGVIPPTMEAMTGNGGRHLYFALHSLKLPPDALGEGLTLLADGAYAIAPPSLHLAGMPYQWAPGRGFGTPIAALPAWIVKADQERLLKLSAEAHKTVPVVTGVCSTEFEEAVTLYVKHNMQRTAPWLPFPAQPGACPICPGANTFKAHDSPTRWVCASPLHTEGGKRFGQFWHGDVLDIDAAQRGRARKKHLEMEMYWGSNVRKLEFQRNRDTRLAAMDSGGAVPVLAPVTPLKSPETKSFASLCEILETPNLARLALGGKALQFNMMSGRPCLDGKPIGTTDLSRIRRDVELNFYDDRGQGLTFAEFDITRAVDLASHANRFSPVQDYLNDLKWDGTPRIPLIPKKILNINNPDTVEIDQAIIFRWMLSAIARARKPGCQADSMLVLYGPEGIRKSSFFKTLGGEWYRSTMIDIRNKDALQQIRAVWIYEWQEMDALQRAKDSEAAKAFLTDAVDHYRPSHEPDVEDVPRNGIFCGTTNHESFLTDLTGDRRFWPMTVTEMINLMLLEQWRDQLWAEADAAFKSGEQWHLTANELRLLEPVHDKHRVENAWDVPVMGWVNKAGGHVTIARILAEALEMEVGKWRPEDEKRVGKILKRHGWAPGARIRLNGVPARPWLPLHVKSVTPDDENNQG